MVLRVGAKSSISCGPQSPPAAPRECPVLIPCRHEKRSVLSTCRVKAFCERPRDGPALVGPQVFRESVITDGNACPEHCCVRLHPENAGQPVLRLSSWQLQDRVKDLIVSPPTRYAEVAELVDAHDSGSCGGFLVGVRVSPSASSPRLLPIASHFQTSLGDSATPGPPKDRTSRCSRRGLRGRGRRRKRRRTQGAAAA